MIPGDNSGTAPIALLNELLLPQLTVGGIG